MGKNLFLLSGLIMTAEWKNNEHEANACPRKHPEIDIYILNVICLYMLMLEIFIPYSNKISVFSASKIVPSWCGWNKLSAEFSFHFRDDWLTPGCRPGMEQGLGLWEEGRWMKSHSQGAFGPTGEQHQESQQSNLTVVMTGKNEAPREQVGGMVDWNQD